MRITRSLTLKGEIKNCQKKSSVKLFFKYKIITSTYKCMLNIRASLSKKSNTKFTRVKKGMKVVKSATNKLI